MEGVLESILINTYNPNSELRLQAEKSLGEFLQSPGALIVLLRYVSNVNTHKELRQATGIAIKNKIREFWIDEVNAYVVTIDEKEIAKELILRILLDETDNSIREIMGEVVYVVSQTDFPEKWPAILPTVIAHIQNSDVLKVYNSLFALRKLVKRYEFKQKEKRAPLNHMVQTCFPLLEHLMQQVLQNNSLEAAQIMRMCLKTFWSSTNFALPDAQGVNVNLWFEMIASILNKRLPEASEGLEPFGQPLSIDDRKVWPWWKVKKWAAKIIAHFIQRYGNPRYAGDDNKAFADYFRANSATMLMGPAMNVLASKAQGQFVTDAVHRHCLTYISSCVEMSPTYKVLKPHLDFILFEVTFPTLCLTEKDLELFEEDPVEFVRKVHNPLEDWLDPTVAATNLLQVLARYRQKDAMPKLLPYIQNILIEYQNAPFPEKNHRKKDGAIVAVASIAKIMMDNKAYAGQIIPFIVSHVLPEFYSPVAFLRSRACWAIEYFDDVDWSTAPQVTINNKTTSLLEAVLEGLISGLRDKALPVQAAAACSLRLLISAKGATELLRPILPDLVREYFRIMDEVGNEAVLSALQTIVEEYSEEIVPMAPMMIAQLVECFKQFSIADQDDDEAAFTATQCLDTIGSVFNAVQDNVEILVQLEPLVLPLINRVLSSANDFEYLDNVVEMMSYFTYYSETISPGMWGMCGPLLCSLKIWAIDYIMEMMVPILNYLTKDVMTFLQGSYNNESFVIILLAVVQDVFDSDTEEGDSKGAAVLLTCLITCSKEQQAIHNLMQPILEMVIKRFNTSKKKSLQHKLTDVNTLQSVLVQLFTHLKDITDVFSKRLIVLSMTSLIELSADNSNSIPSIITSNTPAMYKQIITQIDAINKEDGDDNEFVDADEMNDDEEDGSDNDDEDPMAKRAAALHVPDGGYDEDEDCLNAEDEEYRKAIEKMTKEERVKRQLFIDGELVDGEEDEEDDMQFTSPIENMDMNKYFIESMTSLSARNPHLAASLQSTLSPEELTLLQTIAETAK